MPVSDGKYIYSCVYINTVNNGYCYGIVFVTKFLKSNIYIYIYRGADKSLTRTTSRCILFDGEDISFDASLVIYINSTNIPPIMIINRIYEHQNLLSL
jgi:hypothetical protein